MTRTEWKRIVTDWAEAFPELKPCGKRRLGKRAGPLYVGILIETESGGRNYLPIAHVHNLALPSETMALCLRRGPRFEWTSFAKHPSRFDVLVEAVDRESAVPLRRPFGWATVQAAVAAQPEYGRDPFSFCALECLVAAAAWSGDQGRIERAIAQACSTTASWPDRFFDEGFTRASFEERLRSMALPRVELETVVHEQAVALGFADVPVEELSA